MTDKEKLEIAIQYLRDIVDPTERLRRILPKGYKLNGIMSIRLSEDPEYLKGLGKDALKEIGR